MDSNLNYSTPYSRDVYLRLYETKKSPEIVKRVETFEIEKLLKRIKIGQEQALESPGFDFEQFKQLILAFSDLYNRKLEFENPILVLLENFCELAKKEFSKEINFEKNLSSLFSDKDILEYLNNNPTAKVPQV